jgi:ribosome-interacting GTPase 1
LAKLKRELIEGASSGAGAGKGEGFAVRKAGSATVGMIGFPSVGKSTLLTKLTGHFSESAEYEFTTLTTVPGIIHYKGARLQVRTIKQRGKCHMSLRDRRQIDDSQI